MIFRKSTEKDLKNIMKIINEAKAFLKNNKVDQWQNGYPNEGVILKDIRNNISYVLEDTGEIIGTTSLSFDVEETIIIYMKENGYQMGNMLLFIE